MSDVADATASAMKIAEAIASLPPLPETAQEILACFGDEFIDADQVAAVVEADPGICARLLGLANSAFFGLAEPVYVIREAITRVLGVDTVRSLVLAMAIQQSFDAKKCPAFNARRFWAQSLLTAACSKRIATADDLASDDTRELAYSTGLCHNLGLMALAHMQAEITHSVLLAQQEHVQPGGIRDLFMARLGVEPRIMTAELARAWLLPDLMVDAYQQRAFPEKVCEERLGLIITSAAAAVCNMEVEEEERVDLSAWARDLEITADELQQMAVFGERQQEQVLSLVGTMSG